MFCSEQNWQRCKDTAKNTEKSTNCRCDYSRLSEAYELDIAWCSMQFPSKTWEKSSSRPSRRSQSHSISFFRSNGTLPSNEFMCICCNESKWNYILWCVAMWERMMEIYLHKPIRLWRHFYSAVFCCVACCAV